MKIAYLANVKFPGRRAHVVQIAHMCQAFKKNGVEVDLYVNKRDSAEITEINAFLGFPATFSLYRLAPKFFFPKINLAFYLSEFIFSMAFLVQLRSRTYDVVYSRHEWVVFFLSFFISAEKLIWESHEAKYNFPAKTLLSKSIRCVCISEGIFDIYTEKGVPAAQLLVAHDAVDESFFLAQPSKSEVRKRLGLPLADKIIMYIGGFDAWKGVETFFQASNLVSNVKFVAIGGTKETIALYRERYPNVLFLGMLPYRDLSANQQAADVLVIPNTAKNVLSQKLTSPLKLFAHITSGVPLVVSDIESLRNVLGERAVTFVPDDSTNLSIVVQDVLRNYVLHKTKAEEIQKLSVQYTWDNRAKLILNFISNKI